MDNQNTLSKKKKSCQLLRFLKKKPLSTKLFILFKINYLLIKNIYLFIKIENISYLFIYLFLFIYY